jgi:hypothetical protein
MRYSRARNSFEKPHFESSPTFVSLALSDVSGIFFGLENEWGHLQSDSILGCLEVARVDYSLVLYEQGPGLIQPSIPSLLLFTWGLHIAEHPVPQDTPCVCRDVCAHVRFEVA